MDVVSPTRQRGAYEGVILKILRDSGPTSRTGLSAITGLSPTTITKTVAPLVASGLLAERPDEHSGLGRPPIALVPVPEALTVCGVQIGVGRVRLGLADAQAHVRHVRSYDFDPAQSPEGVLDGIAHEVAAMLDRDTGASCIGVGVGAPGPVDHARRTNLLAINLGWSNIAISDALEDRLGIPVVVDHNVRSFALGEARYGGHHAESIAYLYVRTGVGLGVAVRGEPFYGGPGLGGESYLGHTRVVDDGLPCSCGARGCLETLVAEPYLLPALRARKGSSEAVHDVLAELQRLAASDPAAAALESSVLGHLAGALATVVNLFTPELVLVGGALSSLGGAALHRLHELTGDRIFPLLRDSLRIERAPGGDAALIRGAAAIALEVLHYS